MTQITIRDLNGVAEFKQSEQLQRDVWGDDDIPDNSDILLAIQYEGGLVAGAFDGERLLGFVFGFPTQDPTIQHSHRLAVHSDARGLGLGAKLKEYQRDWGRERGIEVVRWTFDPMLAVNATLNIHRLGARARIYYPDYYGAMPGINAGVPSDRVLAEWHIAEPAVQPATDHEGATAQVTIPADFHRLVQSDPAHALSERLRVRQELSDLFAQGFDVVDFDRAACCYVLQDRN